MTLLALLLTVFAAWQWPRDVLSALTGRMAEILPRFDGGAAHHGWLAWGALVALPAVLLSLIGGVLGGILWPLDWAWSAGLLYLALAAAVASEPDEPHAALRHALHGGFAPVFYWLLLGPLGLALYVLHAAFAHAARDGPVAEVAERVTAIVDWLPARAMLLSLALVGNFEETLSAWREHDDKPAAERLAAVVDSTETGAAVLRPLLIRVAILWFAIVFMFALV